MHRDENNESRFLTWVNESYGERTREQCAAILSQTSVNPFSPLEIVSQAQARLYRHEIESAAVLGEVPFDSDFVDSFDG